MNPEQPIDPQQQPAQPQPPVTPPASPIVAPKSRKGLALTLMIMPSALIIASLALAALLRPLFTDSSEGITLLALTNIISFLAGAIGVLTCVPGMVIGIIILVKQKK